MAPRVIVVNGGSSSGKTSIVRQVQGILAEPWLAASIDDFVDLLPPALQDSAEGFGVAAGGAVVVGEVFARLEKAWRAGIAATARAGAPVVVDDVFLAGAASLARWRAAPAGLPAAFVGVRCDPAVVRQCEARAPTVSREWRYGRRGRCTGTSATTWRSTPLTPARRTVPAASSPGCG